MTRGFWEPLKLDWEEGFESSSNLTGKEVFDELLYLDLKEIFESSSSSIEKEVFERTVGSEAGNDDKIWDPRGQWDLRHVATARSKIREVSDGEIREGNGEDDKEHEAKMTRR